MDLHPQTVGALDELGELVKRLRRTGKMGPSSLKSERFIWGVTYRDGTQDSELLSEGWARVRTFQVATVHLCLPIESKKQGGFVGIEYEIPPGAGAVFTRRRGIALHLDGTPADHVPGWTIIGHEYPDGTGVYYFYHNLYDKVFASPDFNDPWSYGS